MNTGAMSTFVKHGSHLATGGCPLNRNPMAAVYAIIRQKIPHLHVCAHSCGQG